MHRWGMTNAHWQPQQFTGQVYGGIYGQPSFQQTSPATPAKQGSINGWTIVKELNRGSYGTVYLVRKEQSECVYAMKEVPTARHCESEVKLQQSFVHENIVQIIEEFQHGDSTYIAMENCAGGDLFDYIQRASRSGRPLPEADVQRMASQMLAALLELHRRGVVHHDVKLENFLLAPDLTIKLCDFGAAEKVGADGLVDRNRFKGDDSPPEKVRGQTYNGFLADVYQLGKTIYEMVFPPFFAPQGTFRFNPTPGHPYSAALVDVLHGMLQTDPSRRPTLEQVSEHPWFSLTSRQAVPSTPATAPLPRSAIPNSPMSPVILPATPVTADSTLAKHKPYSTRSNAQATLHHKSWEQEQAEAQLRAQQSTMAALSTAQVLQARADGEQAMWAYGLRMW